MFGLNGTPWRLSAPARCTSNPSLPPVADGQRKTGTLVRAAGAFCGAQHGKVRSNRPYRFPCSRNGSRKTPQANPVGPLRYSSP